MARKSKRSPGTHKDEVIYGFEPQLPASVPNIQVAGLILHWAQSAESGWRRQYRRHLLALSKGSLADNAAVRFDFA